MFTDRGTKDAQQHENIYIQIFALTISKTISYANIFLVSDDYFVSNIEKVDSVTLLRKDKVMSGVSWSLRFQQAISTWPCNNDLGSAAVQV